MSVVKSEISGNKKGGLTRGTPKVRLKVVFLHHPGKCLVLMMCFSKQKAKACCAVLDNLGCYAKKKKHSTQLDT